MFCDIRPGREAHPARFAMRHGVQSSSSMCIRCIARPARRLTEETARPCGAYLRPQCMPPERARDTDLDRYAKAECYDGLWHREPDPPSVVPLIAKPLPSFPCALSALRHHSTSPISTGYWKPQSRICAVRAVLCRISAVAASGAEPVPTRATKAYNIAREDLATAVLYDTTETGLKQSRGSRHSTDGNFRRMPQISRTASFGATE
jgi:hypothetical protein